MAMKEYSTLPNALKLEPYRQMQFSVISRTLIEWGGVYASAEMQLAYSSTPADWADQIV